MGSKPETSKSFSPTIRTKQISLLEKLSNAGAVSGNEDEVRSIVIEEVEAFADTLEVDNLGNVLVRQKAKNKNPLRIMIAAHMDEVGFMIVEKENDGIYRFEAVGGIDIGQLIGKPVLVGAEKVPGVIGSRPLHQTEKEETKRKIPIKDLRIDVGLSGSEKIQIGDRATFACRFQRIGPSLCGKALDDRLGVATLIELIRNTALDNVELIAAFTVQEEVGLRGARVAAFAGNPDIAIAVDSTPAIDIPMWDGTENTRYNARLGLGPAVYISDGRTISDPRLVRYFLNKADERGIPYQIRQPGGGGTDAGAMHRQREGIPSISISIPARYAHTAMMIARISDWKHTLALLHVGVTELVPSILDR